MFLRIQKKIFSVNDADDPSDVHFLHRPGENTSLSPRICDVLNHFAEAGGFEALCQNSILYDRWERLEKLSIILANIGTSASHSFVNKFFMKAINALTNGIEKNDDESIEKYVVVQSRSALFKAFKTCFMQNVFFAYRSTQV